MPKLHRLLRRHLQNVLPDWLNIDARPLMAQTGSLDAIIFIPVSVMCLSCLEVQKVGFWPWVTRIPH